MDTAQVISVILTALATAYAVRVTFVFTRYTQGQRAVQDMVREADNWKELSQSLEAYKASASAIERAGADVSVRMLALYSKLAEREQAAAKAARASNLHKLSEADLRALQEAAARVGEASVGLQSVATEGEFMVGQRVVVGHHLGVVTEPPKIHKTRTAGLDGVWVELADFGYPSCYARKNVRALKPGENV